LRELRDRGLRLGLCSNWDWDLARHLQHNQIHDLFDAIVCSASAGFRKPHPRIFASVIDRIAIRPENMLFVGDSWTDDIEGAVAAGFHAVHLARSRCPVAEHRKALCITDLNALVARV
jgi:putative hydrolase of the HAD superfamily